MSGAINTPHHSIRRQRGVVMVIALIALLLMSLIGTTAMRSSTMQEKISGNLRDQDLAFQSAEAALHNAEAYVSSLTTLSQFSNANGLYTTGNAPDVYAAWPTGARKYTGFETVSDVAAPPEYIIEIRGIVEDSVNTSLNLSGGYGVSSGTGDVYIFKIHAKGTGLSDNARVILRTNFARRF
ncbi:MAG: PilX N-terminal domain-containing pilus assembly protein [Pseudomonadota bacterium]